MTDPEAALGRLVQQALADELGAEFARTDPLIRPSGFADFQSNVALSLAKRLGRSPRELAELIAAGLAGSPVVAAAEVSGPGFINLHAAPTAGSPTSAYRPACRPMSRGPRSPIRASGSSWITPARTWPRNCTPVTCARPSSGTRSCGCWSIWATR